MSLPHPHSTASRPRWYVIQCKPRQEWRAFENLERQGFCCYLPTRLAQKLRHGRRLEIQECLFPAYFFIKLDELQDNWHPIRSTRGVIQLVRFNDYPLPVQDDMIEAIHQRLSSNPPRVPYLQPGERVRITAGCFSNLEAIFISDDGDERVTLLMHLLHSEQKLSFPMTVVRKCRA